MSFNNWTDIAGGVIIIGLVTTLVAHRNTAEQVRAAGQAAIGLLRTAMGQKAAGGY